MTRKIKMKIEDFEKLKQNITSEQLLQDFEECKNFTAIGNKYNITKKFVSLLFKHFNIKGSNREKPRQPMPPKEELIKLYSEYGTLDKVANHYDLTASAVVKYFDKYQIPYDLRQKHEINHSFFSEDNELSYYWAGFIAADGCIDKNRNRIAVVLKSTDIGHIEKLKKHIGSTHPITQRIAFDKRPEFKTGEYHGSVFRFSSKQMKDDLYSKFDIGSAKSLTYGYPKLNSVYEKHFIRGLIDGDGWITHNIIGLCGTKDTLEGVFNSLNLTLNLNRGRFFQQYGKDNLWVLNYGALEEKKKIIHYLFDDATIWLDRKKIEADLILQEMPRKKAITKEMIIEAFVKEPDANKVGALLGCSKVTLFRRIREFGLQGGKYRI